MCIAHPVVVSPDYDVRFVCAGFTGEFLGVYTLLNWTSALFVAVLATMALAAMTDMDFNIITHVCFLKLTVPSFAIVAW